MFIGDHDGGRQMQQHGKERAEAIARALMADACQRQDAARTARLRRRLYWQQRGRAGRRALPWALLVTLLAVVFAVVVLQMPLSWRLLLRGAAFAGFPAFLLLRWRLLRRDVAPEGVIEL